jgi:hypothetical protein
MGDDYAFFGWAECCRENAHKPPIVFKHQRTIDKTAYMVREESARMQQGALEGVSAQVIPIFGILT